MSSLGATDALAQTPFIVLTAWRLKHSMVRLVFCILCWRITLVCQWPLGSVRYSAARAAVGSRGHVAWRLTWQAVKCYRINEIEDSKLTGPPNT